MLKNSIKSYESYHLNILGSNSNFWKVGIELILYLLKGLGLNHYSPGIIGL